MKKPRGQAGTAQSQEMLNVKPCHTLKCMMMAA